MARVDRTKITKQQERQLLRAWEETIDSVRDQAALQEIAFALNQGDVEAVVNMLGITAATFAPVFEVIRQSYRAGGTATGEMMGRIPKPSGAKATLQFDMRSENAEAWLSRLSSRRIVEIVEDQRAMVRDRLAAAVAQGRNPRSAALDLVGRVGPDGVRRGGFIGLTQRQAQWVSSARDELDNLDVRYFSRKLRDKRYDGVVRRAIESGKPLDQRRKDKIIASLQARTQRYRAETIARTETVTALRAGQDEAVKQAIQTAGIDEQDVTKTWDASGDRRTRPDHAEMDGQTVPEGDPFRFPDGSQAMYPGDGSLGAPADQIINCRCRVIHNVDFIGRQARVEGFR